MESERFLAGMVLGYWRANEMGPECRDGNEMGPECLDGNEMDPECLDGKKEKESLNGLG